MGGPHFESAVLRVLTRQDDVLGRAAPRFSPTRGKCIQLSSGSHSSKQDYLADLGAGVMDAVADEEDSVKSPQPLPPAPPGATIPDPLEA